MSGESQNFEMLPFDNLVTLAQSFVYQAKPDPTQWHDAASHTFEVELQELHADLQALIRVVLTVDLIEMAVGL
ncbi:MAG: hypothetical protein ACKORF_07505 [Micrococcales bacterium]